MKNKTFVKRITTISMLIAISVVLRLLGFPQSGTFRVEIGFLPIAIAGSVFGPYWAGAAYVIADVIGTLFTGQTPFITITVCKLIMGFCFGLFFYKDKHGLKRIVLCVTCITIFIDLIAMPFALYPIMGGKGILAIFTERIWASLFNYPLRILTLWGTFRYLSPFIRDKLNKI